MSLRRALGLGVLLVMLAPGVARADGWIVPFIGVTFGGDSGEEFEGAVDAGVLNWGFSAAYMGAGIFGAEFDLGVQPDFFGKNDQGDSTVLTTMGNLLIGIPFGGTSGFGIRPYVLAGAGLVRTEIDDLGNVLEAGTNHFGWNFGGGFLMFFSDHFGMRGDIRYIRTFDDLDIEFLDPNDDDDFGKVDFSRATLGFVLRF